MSSYVAYYRASTRGQSLSLEAQQEAVARFLTPSDKLCAEYTEIESGKRHDNRPQLISAVAECRRRKAVLVIARLDRLARNVAFVSALMESGIAFIACDLPHANKLTIHILAAMAEYERELISLRTKEGLAAAKARGVILGNPRLAEARVKALASLRRKRELAATG